MIKTLSKLGIEGNFLNLRKNIYKKSYLMVRNMKISHFKVQGMDVLYHQSFSTLYRYFNF